jgi:hypothetical protein
MSSINWRGYKPIDGSEWAIVIGVVCVLGIVAWSVWYNWQYPCIQSHTEPCTQYQTAYSFTSDGKSITTYIPYEGTCTVCDERSERK